MLKIELIGHIGQDATVKVLDGDRKVINFSVAVSEKWKNQQGVQLERTDWIRCSYFRDNAAVADYLKKGTMVYVSGKPSVSAYNAQGGELRANQECTVVSIQLLSSSRNNQPQTGQPAAAAAPGDMTEPLDDLPF